MNTIWIVDNSWWDGHERGLADVDGVRGLGTSENHWALEEVQQGRGQSFTQLPFSLSYEKPTDAAHCSNLIGCDTPDQNEHQGKSNKAVNICRLVLEDFDLGEDEIQSNSERERSRDMLSWRHTCSKHVRSPWTSLSVYLIHRSCKTQRTICL